MIGEDKVIRFSGVQRGEACTVVLRGPSMQILDEAERSLHDALCVLSQGILFTIKNVRPPLIFKFAPKTKEPFLVQDVLKV